MTKLHFLFLTFLFFLQPTLSQAQVLKQADSLFNISKFKKAESIYLSKRAEAIVSKDWETLVYCNIKLAGIIRINGGNRLAIKLLEENDSIINSYINNPLLISKNLIAKAEAYYNLSDMAKFKVLIDSSYHINKSINSKDSSIVAEDLMHLGRYYLSISKFDKMRAYALSARSKIKNHNDLRLTRILNLIGYSYHAVGSYDSALIYYDSALLVLKKQQRNDPKSYAMLYRNIGNSNNDLIGNKDKEPKKATYHFKEALKNYNKELAVSKGFSSPSERAVIDFVISYAYTRFNKLDSAEDWIDKGIRELMPNFELGDLLNIAKIEKSPHDDFLLLLLNRKTSLLKAKYEKTTDVKYLVQAHQYLTYRVHFHQFLLANSTSDFENLRIYNLYDGNDIGKLAETTFQLKSYPNKEELTYQAFELISLEKYGLTFKNTLQQYAKEKSATYQQFLIEEEYKALHSKLESITIIANKAVKNQQPKTVLNANTKNYRLLFDSLYQQLTDDIAIIDYNFYGKNAYVFILLADTLILKKLPISDNFVQTNGFSSVKESLNKSMINQNPQEFYNNSKQIFNELVKPIYPIIKHKTQWVIIPNTYTSSLPFEALPLNQTKKNIASFKEIDFLINHHIISYAPTAHAVVSRARINSSNILGFAPTFYNESQLSELPFSSSLLTELKSSFKGNYYHNKEATKHVLFKERDNPSILHIATHFKLDKDNPEQTVLYCYDNNKQLSTIQSLEILELPYAPELTILSGCQTDVGKSFAGEGSLSFGRYFMKLGSPSIITTLWEVDDKASKEVLSLFYTYLEDGLPKNIALHKAKLNYLANLNEHQTANPINWAGYVLIGNYEPIALDKKVVFMGVSIWYYVVGIALIGVFIMLLLRLKSNY